MALAARLLIPRLLDETHELRFIPFLRLKFEYGLRYADEELNVYLL